MVTKGIAVIAAYEVLIISPSSMVIIRCVGKIKFYNPFISASALRNDSVMFENKCSLFRTE